MGGEGIYNYFSIAPALVPFYPFSVIFLNQVIIPSFHVCPCVCCMYMYACVAVVWCGVVWWLLSLSLWIVAGMVIV